MIRWLWTTVWGLALLIAVCSCGLVDSEDSASSVQECNYRSESSRVLFAERLDINGYVRGAEGNPISGVKITKQGGHGGWTLTDAQGYYLVGNNIPGLDYCLVPSKTGCAFEPTRRCYEYLNQHYHDQNLTAICE
jgi:hypothetical protein